MALATIAGPDLTAALKPQLMLLVDDMRIRLDADAVRLAQWRATHLTALQDKRTAAAWTDWLEDQLTQAAVGWLLTSVFVRFCEDNLLLGESEVWIAGPTPTLRQRAVDAENAFYQANQAFSYREWLEESFAALRSNHATASLVDDHAALEIMEPSSDAVAQLLAFWRRTDDSGELIWSFADSERTTRFLGDLYQDLSDYAKKKYALLQTPEFVEEFILDHTMEPALKDRPLEGFTLIDPTCGSGHFLLGAFDRLMHRWNADAPGLEPRTRVNKALESIYGVDLNPFAVAIAKFRLIVAAMKAAGDHSLVHAPKLTLNLAAGDSLLHGPEAGGKVAIDYGTAAVDKDAVASNFTYSTENAAYLRRVLTLGQYDVVVGNPPYITVSDKALNARYRERFHYCKGKYALTVPFMERFFTLARGGDRPGWVGQITSNSFMKREFGVPLVEEFFPRVDLQCIIDSEGAWIPGHNMDGTPTTIIFGRNRAPAIAEVRCVLSMGVREMPTDASIDGYGPYWSSIVDHVDEPGYEDQWISVIDLPRVKLAEHPWSLSGGGAVQLLDSIKQKAARNLSDIASEMGMTYLTGEDEVFLVPPRSPLGRGLLKDAAPVVIGSEVRDYGIRSQFVGITPIALDGKSAELSSNASRHLWTYRTVLGRRLYFGKSPVERGLRWFDTAMFFANRHATALSIAFAFVATHNHFVLDRGGKVFKQSAPVIKMPAGTNEDDHLRLLGVLNSSTACFWLKENSQPKGGAAERSWSRTFEFTATTLLDYPIPASTPVMRARRLDHLASGLARYEPAASIGESGATRVVVDAARTGYEDLRAEMIAEQEELDWEVYRLYGLIDDDLTSPLDVVPRISLGERAFEILLGRRIAAGEMESEWFARHGSSPITEVPARWPAEYQELVHKRLDAIESNPFIRLLERPEYKRRWAAETWDVKLQRALRDWLLDKLEDPALWMTQQGTPSPRSVGEIAGEMERDPKFIEALDLWAGRRDAPVTDTLVKLLADQAVPYLAAQRYKDSGLRKRAEWERVWDLQRDEDAGRVNAADIPVPPKYTNADFRKTSYWSHRGKLDVPKERFIAYPDAGRATDPTPLLGWAGWDHAQQGLALATIYAARESEGMPLENLIPLVAGVAELLPWVKQWHSGVDPVLGVDMVEYLTGRLHETAGKVQIPIAELKDWRPPAPTRGRTAAVSSRKAAT